MMAFTSVWPGGTNYLDIGSDFPSHAKIVVTVSTEFGNVNAWSAYENGSWRIYVSDSSFVGQVSYLII